jgi:hypothetical protein
VLSLALNLVLTGFVIVVVKALIRPAGLACGVAAVEAVAAEPNRSRS